MEFPHLFQPISLGNVEIKNRIFMSPMHTGLSENSEGYFTQKYIDYYKERAKNGVGLVITGHVKAECQIDPYPVTYKFPCLDTPAAIKYFAELVDVIHECGSRVAIELSAGTGRLADAVLPDHYPAAPSAVPLLVDPSLQARELTKKEINQLTEAYGRAAGYAKAAGFDIIYVHATAYLIDQFLTPCWNKRTDEYGGSLENRMRFMLECIASARKHVGEDFPLMVGMSMQQGVPGGRSMEENIAIARELEKQGIVALHLRHGSYDAMNMLIPSNLNPMGIAVDAAGEINLAVHIPVLVDGGLMMPAICERVLAENKADMVGLGRPLLADPQWVLKARENRSGEIRPCLRCMECLNRTFLGYFAGCSVNPRLGRESEPAMDKVDNPKRVLVIGGGLAGMLASMYAAQKGHHVTLVEKKDALGGHMLEASKPDFKKETAAYLRWLEDELEKSDVKVKTSLHADKEYVKKMHPDAVIMCGGSVPVAPVILGINGENVRYATDILLDHTSVGKEVLVVGSGLVGCETAIYLAKRKREVTLIDMTPEIGMNISPMSKGPILVHIKELRIKCLPGLKLTEVHEGGVKVADGAGNEQALNCDTVILATGMEADQELWRDLYDEVEEIYQIGDSVKPRKFINAAREAYAVVKEL